MYLVLNVKTNSSQNVLEMENFLNSGRGWELIVKKTSVDSGSPSNKRCKLFETHKPKTQDALRRKMNYGHLLWNQC